MKKIFLSLFILLISLFCISCNKQEENKEETDEIANIFNGTIENIKYIKKYSNDDLMGYYFINDTIINNFYNYKGILKEKLASNYDGVSYKFVDENDQELIILRAGELKYKSNSYDIVVDVNANFMIFSKCEFYSIEKVTKIPFLSKENSSSIEQIEIVINSNSFYLNTEEKKNAFYNGIDNVTLYKLDDKPDYINRTTIKISMSYVFFETNGEKEYLEYNDDYYYVLFGSLSFINEYNESNTDEKQEGGGGWLPYV